MLPIIFLAALLLPPQQASVTCGNETQTQPVRGPDGTIAVLKVSSEDDHSKNSHLCLADYQLLITRASEREPTVVQVLYSDGEWDRELSVRLNGFSQDGKRIFGVLSEGGATPIQDLLDYDTVNGQVRTIDLRKQLVRISGDKCRVAADVIGTTQAGAAVLELSSTDQCLPKSRWSLDPLKGRLRRVPEGTTVLSLHK